MKETIKQLEREIERISNLPDELYSKEKLEIAKAKLKTLQEVCEEIKKTLPDEIEDHCEKCKTISTLSFPDKEELLKKFQGGDK